MCHLTLLTGVKARDELSYVSALLNLSERPRSPATWAQYLFIFLIIIIIKKYYCYVHMEWEMDQKRMVIFKRLFLGKSFMLLFVFSRLSQTDHVRSGGILRGHSVLPAGERPLWHVGNANWQ